MHNCETYIIIKALTLIFQLKCVFKLLFSSFYGCFRLMLSWQQSYKIGHNFTEKVSKCFSH